MREIPYKRRINIPYFKPTSQKHPVRETLSCIINSMNHCEICKCKEEPDRPETRLITIGKSIICQTCILLGIEKFREVSGIDNLEAQTGIDEDAKLVTIGERTFCEKDILIGMQFLKADMNVFLRMIPREN
jgi:hypothetical protein